MKLDLAAEAGPDHLEAELCIIGAGAAGIAIARRLGRAGRRAILLEVGGYDYDPAIQDAYAGESIGRPYHGLDHSRMRFFGGTTNHWGGWCRPLEPIDFEAREGLPHPGWPFGIETLAPWYAEAHPLVEIGPPTYDVGFWERASGRRPVDLGPSIETRVVQFSPPSLFGLLYRDELEAMETVTVVLHAPVVDMRTDGGGRLDRVEVATASGRRLAVRAGRFVLACGGIENARLLLNCTGDQQAGLGNGHDLVGRYFNDHITIEGSHLFLGRDLDLSGYSPFHRPRVPRSALPGAGPEAEGLPDLEVQYLFTPSPDLLRREGLSNAAIHIMPQTHRREARWSGEAVAGLAGTVADWGPIDQAAAHARTLRDHAGSLLPAVLQTLGVGGIGPDAYRVAMLKTIIEQVPLRDSRVTLADEVDRHGLRRARLDWQWAEADRRTAQRSQEILAQAVGEAGHGRIRIDLPEDEVSLGVWESRSRADTPTVVSTGRHHMGTTRMHPDPRQGVVDADCRVHGLENLYIAGSSVFPTGGLWNPTLTILALALRLADHLEAQA